LSRFFFIQRHYYKTNWDGWRRRNPSNRGLWIQSSVTRRTLEQTWASNGSGFAWIHRLMIDSDLFLRF